MSRDMKPRKSTASSSRKKSGGNTLVGLFVGLVIGVLGAAGVVWYIYKTPAPFSNKGQPPPQSVATQQGATGTTGPMPLPGKPGDPIPQNGDKPRFDFYKILPGNAEAIPDPKPTEAKAGDGKGKNEKDGLLSEPVFLQTGSFQNAGDARTVRANETTASSLVAKLLISISSKLFDYVGLDALFGKLGARIVNFGRLLEGSNTNPVPHLVLQHDLLHRGFGAHHGQLGFLVVGITGILERSGLQEDRFGQQTFFFVLIGLVLFSLFFIVLAFSIARF